MNREASLGATLRRLTSRIENKRKRRSKERTLRYEKKLTKHPCSRRSWVPHLPCARFFLASPKLPQQTPPFSSLAKPERARSCSLGPSTNARSAPHTLL